MAVRCVFSYRVTREEPPGLFCAGRVEMHGSRWYNGRREKEALQGERYGKYFLDVLV